MVEKSADQPLGVGVKQPGGVEKSVFWRQPEHSAPTMTGKYLVGVRQHHSFGYPGGAGGK